MGFVNHETPAKDRVWQAILFFGSDWCSAADLAKRAGVSLPIAYGVLQDLEGSGMVDKRVMDRPEGKRGPDATEWRVR